MSRAFSKLTAAPVRCHACNSIITGIDCPLGYLLWNGTPVEPQLFAFTANQNPTILFNQAHGALIRLFFLFRQVEADRGRDPTTKDFTKAVRRNHLSVARALVGTLPPRYERTFYRTRLVHQWAMILSWYWRAEGGPDIYVQLGPHGSIMPVAIYPDGSYHEDSITRELRERKQRPHDKPWGYSDSNEHYDKLIRKTERVNERARKRYAKGKGATPKKPTTKTPKTKTKTTSKPSPFPPRSKPKP